MFVMQRPGLGLPWRLQSTAATLLDLAKGLPGSPAAMEVHRRPRWLGLFKFDHGDQAVTDTWKDATAVTVNVACRL